MGRKSKKIPLEISVDKKSSKSMTDQNLWSAQRSSHSNRILNRCVTEAVKIYVFRNMFKIYIAVIKNTRTRVLSPAAHVAAESAYAHLA